jgi:hypothetical protein
METSFKEPTMTQHATVTDYVTYRPGDGAEMAIPEGPIDVELSADSATMSWVADNGSAGLTAIPLTQYKEYVQQKKIVPSTSA